MDYIDLHRRFARIEPERPFSAEAWQGAAGPFLGGLGWVELLERPRVVVLAEASAGKSAEFVARAETLRREGKFAFYVTVEALASHGLDRSLGRDEAEQFAEWQQSDATAWFFLDSVDEARLNQKSVDLALGGFARDLGPSYDRARILLSCRGTIWSGTSDLELVRKTLRVRPAPRPPVDPDEALLGNAETAVVEPVKTEQVPDVTVVALTKLSNVQRKALLSAADIPEIEHFESQLFARGLQQLADRPGDLLTLAGYWQKYRKFGSLSEMLDLGISERLAERGDARRTLSGRTDDEMRAGAERLAAALVLGRSMNLNLPGQLPTDASALDPREILSDWLPADVERLLERGLFVPATFGLIRFYHRSAQEYLAACWFRRMGARLTDPELHRIFLADALGIRTIPPSLRASAAWLALWRPSLRQHLLEREPLVLLSHGDPGALTLDEKSRLLASYADRDARGDIASSRIDHQSLWMFAEQDLAPAINAAVAANDRPDFRFEMLRLIEEGEIAGSVGIARAAALESFERPYHCIVATRILKRLNDDAGLKAVAAHSLAHVDKLGAELAPALAVELFPNYFSVDDLLAIIALSTPGRQYQSEGFGEELVLLFDACPGAADRTRLIAGLAALPFEPPLAEWPKLSDRHRRLTARLAPVAARALVDADQIDYGPALIRLLMAVERAGIDRQDEPSTPLTSLVATRPALKETLFWADVAEADREVDQEKPVAIRNWRQVWPGYHILWSFVPDDRSWLEAGLHRPDADEREVALSGLISLARASTDDEAALDALAERVADDARLSEVLAEARRPAVEDERTRKLREKHQFHVQREKAQKLRDDQSWLDLRDRLQADPTRLKDPDILQEWPGPHSLLRLTDWLAARQRRGRDAGMRDWEMLRDAFGDAVADAYRAGLAVLWRVTPPERPEATTDGKKSIKYSIILSHDAIGLEAAEDKQWARKLSPAEADIAARHACLDEQGTARWIGDLLESHPDVVTPHVVKEVRREWTRGSEFRPMLELAASGMMIPPLLRATLLALIRSGQNMSPELMATTARILGRLDLSADERRSLARLFDRRFALHREAGGWDALVNCVATLFLLDQKLAARRVLELLAAERRRRHKSRAYQLLSRLFGRHRGIVGALGELDPATLAPLILEAYRERARVVPSDPNDEDEDGGVSDRFDEAGGLALNALLESEGADAHWHMLWLSRQSAVGKSAHRLRELAYGMAERNSERPPWKADAPRRFEEKMLAPTATGDDLMGVVLDILEAIDASFEEADMSSRKVVETAVLENAVQDWLGEALNLRSEGRFHAHKEAQITYGDRPDLTITSTSSTDQLAIEVKHGSKGWSLVDLRAALKDQLAGKYLLPAVRRHGILFISHHKDARFWRDKAQRRTARFPDVIAELQRLADTITENSNGPVRIAVRGVDATPGRRPKRDASEGGAG